MSTRHRKLLSQGNIIPHHNQNPPGVSKFRDFQALALHLHSSSIYKNPDGASQFDHLVSSKIPPPPCRLPPPCNNAVSAKEELDDPFLLAYKECTKSVKNKGINNDVGVVKKSKFLFGRFSCKTIHSCDITDNSFFKLPRDTIHVSTWK
ncbi:hypothetical protein Csa_003745 [Cucumis sativus]|uniref:Uncharacterized protein n=1 Tax=Cucumis sativus TaxID=3659 RepID=A0A0A0KGJ1_CUCSA|nr:hypothetical protein Csa_003745 [Cucumis sativus]